MKAIIVSVSNSLLCQELFKWPDGVRVSDCRMAFGTADAVELTLESDQFEDVPEGHLIPTKCAEYRSTRGPAEFVGFQ